MYTCNCFSVSHLIILYLLNFLIFFTIQQLNTCRFGIELGIETQPTHPHNLWNGAIYRYRKACKGMKYLKKIFKLYFQGTSFKSIFWSIHAWVAKFIASKISYSLLQLWVNSDTSLGLGMTYLHVSTMKVTRLHARVNTGTSLEFWTRLSSLVNTLGISGWVKVKFGTINSHSKP
mgnify:CR=1 FL=1